MLGPDQVGVLLEELPDYLASRGATSDYLDDILDCSLLVVRH
ncbi:MAG TPA: hypothetical protein VF874_08765 [Mycobacterium sp.]|jgi:hypothetical protein